MSGIRRNQHSQVRNHDNGFNTEYEVHLQLP